MAAPHESGHEVAYLERLKHLSGGRESAYLDQKWRVYDEQIKRKVFDKIGVKQEPG